MIVRRISGQSAVNNACHKNGSTRTNFHEALDGRDQSGQMLGATAAAFGMAAGGCLNTHPVPADAEANDLRAFPRLLRIRRSSPGASLRNLAGGNSTIGKSGP